MIASLSSSALILAHPLNNDCLHFREAGVPAPARCRREVIVAGGRACRPILIVMPSALPTSGTQSETRSPVVESRAASATSAMRPIETVSSQTSSASA